MNKFRNKLGKIIKMKRLKENISQEVLANKTNLHRTYISDIERGKRNISIDNLLKISKALKIRLYKLIKDVDNNE